jgi:hypothetical protein
MRGARFVVVAMAVTTMGCKLKVEASMKGFEVDTIKPIIHVVTDPGATIDCELPGCYGTVPPSGQLDLTLSAPEAGKEIVVVKAKKGFKKGQVTVDLSGKTLPPKLALDDDGSFICRSRNCSGTITLAPSASVAGTSEPGTIFKIGNDTLTAGADGKVAGPLSLTLTPPLAQQPLSKICVGFTRYSTKNVMTTVPMTVTFPDKQSSSVTSPIDVDLVEKNLAKFLAGVTNGPVLFPWEKPGTPAKGKRAAAFVYENDCYDAGAADATVGDLDVVAVAENSKRVGDCTYHSKDDTKTGKTTMYDLNATVYDRITGKKLATKTFAAPKECLVSFTAKKGSSAPEASSVADREGVAKWAATFAR